MYGQVHSFLMAHKIPNQVSHPQTAGFSLHICGFAVIEVAGEKLPEHIPAEKLRAEFRLKIEVETISGTGG